MYIFYYHYCRDFEPVRLLGLQFIGRLLVGLPFEKKGSSIFNISVGRSKSMSESHKKISLDTQPIFSIVSDRLFKFPQTDLLCATLFDVLLGGASPKQVAYNATLHFLRIILSPLYQILSLCVHIISLCEIKEVSNAPEFTIILSPLQVLRKQNQPDRQKNSRNNSEFFLPQVLPLIFRYLSGCGNRISRVKLIGDLLDLLDSNPSNIEALMVLSAFCICSLY